MSWGTGGSTYVSTVAIGYKPSTNQEVCTVKAGLYKSGSPADSVIMTVRGGGNGYPIGGNVMATVTIPGSRVASPPFLPQQSAYTTFILSPCLNLTAGINYTLVFNRTQPGSAGSYISQISSLIYYSQTKFWAYVPVNGFWQEKFPYTPALRLEGPEPPALTPVLIIPGIAGSELYNGDDLIWPDLTEMLTDINDEFLRENLMLGSDGNSIMPITVGGVVERIPKTPVLDQNIFEDLREELESNGYILDQDLFFFPYDWRLNLDSSKDLLNTAIEEIKSQTGALKVNIIAHSMGGLVTKEYLSRPDALNVVNNVILLGVPNLGAPKAFKVLNYGDDFDLNRFGVGLNEQKAKEISQNMPGVYELLPSRRYIDIKGGYVRDFRHSRNLTLDYDQTNQFMLDDSDLPDYRNGGLLSTADTYHQVADSQTTNGPTTFNIMGCQNPDTIGEIRLYDDGNVDITAVDGDGTVPTLSARANSNSYQNYYALYGQLEVNHTGLVKNETITDFVANLIQDSNVVAPNGVSQSIGDCLAELPNPTRIIFSTHSPVVLHIYDDQNRHTGPNSSGDVEMGIPGSNYFVIGENHFAYVPADIQYRVVIDAIASGNFDFKVKSYNGSILNGSIVYVDVPIQSESFVGEMNYLNMNGDLSLQLDQDGNDIPESTIQPSSVLTNIDEEDAIPPGIIINSPASSSYTRAEQLLLDVSVADDLSGVGLVKNYLDGTIIATSSIDLFFTYLGNHSFETFAFDNAGNPAYANQFFKVIATPDSTISDIERAYDLGWIEKKGVKNGLINKLELAIRIEKRIEVLEEKLPDKPKIIKKIERLEKHLDRVLGTAFLNQLEKEYNKGNINEQAYNLLKEDIGWLLR